MWTIAHIRQSLLLTIVDDTSVSQYTYPEGASAESMPKMLDAHMSIGAFSAPMAITIVNS